VVLEGGTLTSSAGPRCGLPVLRILRGGRGAESERRVRFVGTLLGPEGAGNRCFIVGAVLFLVPLCSLRGARVWRGRGGGVWSYVENCTVDASIF
jgi:hypothetical protein